jgi:hypothetical protein
MPKVTIDGKEYDLEALSAKTKNQLTSIQFVDTKITDLQDEPTVCPRFGDRKKRSRDHNPNRTWTFLWINCGYGIKRLWMRYVSIRSMSLHVL